MKPPFVFVAVVTTLMLANCPAFAIQIEDATIQRLQHAFKTHEITCEQLVNSYLNRIQKYNFSSQEQAPINAFTEINPSLFDDARRLDELYSKTKKLAGPLHCVPVIIKDNIDSKEMTTTSGSYALLGNQPIHDAPLTARLRAAGAIIIGKGAMDEFAWGTFGLSSRSGRIGNVYNTNYNAGGSSGGSAAAVSANFAMVGVGTDNSGSVRIPSVFNGVIGLRPTQGLIEHQGVFPMGNLHGTAGPIARTTTDLALLLDVIADPAKRNAKSYSSNLTPQGLQGKRIGILRSVGKVDTFKKMSPVVLSECDKTIEIMKAQGATFSDVNLTDFVSDRTDNQAGEIEDINAYLSSFPATRKDFSDICESERTRNFGDKAACLDFMTSIPPHSSAAYQRVQTMLQQNKQTVLGLMDKNKLDALLMPFQTQPSGGYDPMAINVWQAPVSSNTGLPAIDFVVGWTPDLRSIGVDLIGREWDEGTLLGMTYAFEQATHLRRVPAMPSADSRLLDLSIPEINNLITVIGKYTYDNVIKNTDTDDSLISSLNSTEFKKIMMSVLKSYLE